MEELTPKGTDEKATARWHALPWRKRFTSRYLALLVMIVAAMAFVVWLIVA